VAVALDVASRAARVSLGEWSGVCGVIVGSFGSGFLVTGK
jgi:hypothetical protein